MDLPLRSSLVSIVVVTAGAAAIWVMVLGLNRTAIPQVQHLAGRLLLPLPMGLFLLAIVVLQAAQCQVAYLRAHKKEPIVVLSMVCCVTTGLLVWSLGRTYGPAGAGAGYLGMAFVTLIWMTVIWQRCGKQWHGE